ncbi:uncharacterized protein Nmag_0045 [Natrialba magadii ATCC 43099]|uniref:Halobacterial output domain-containing protein n=1 Tax=Natrialba magadii (strain ATCC 43099 / DSM 3394 / CCM 3739 / CIP 104546 / IAM 13178 / JCM 8861 / NBRC 102185 / NCIMB 2190 / MS3) TaxID=547559 RepID=D3SVS5_NATMM|nr:HalOD1 output domain-containing protein [Natrialba magadii]ADD03644.1 uncharacterized protein Nmag_0045 [Natrialba magadii ATCC 43099]ELY34411.1 hypothetical protein C500_00712 [Natrialba magadii ATCC 43099]
MGTGIDPSQNVIQQIAAIEGLEPTELEPPLYEVIDPSALDVLVRSTTRATAIGARPDAEAGTGTGTGTGTGMTTETGTDTETGTGTAYTPTEGLSQIVFVYRGHRVRVDGTGAVEITPRQYPESGSNPTEDADAQSD